MMYEMKHAIMACGVLLCCRTPAHAEALQTMNDVGRAIEACWTVPEGVQGSVTLSFSFKRDGTLFGRPRTTAIGVKGDQKTRDQFIASAVQALETCTPLTLSPALAQGIAGQVFTMPFTAGQPADVAPQ
ncbi:MAG: hypothetical protein ACRECY_06080 [Phyllobacterium sp.]